MQQIVSDHYEIYHDRRSVIVYSTDRLTFESKGWQIQLKSDVRNAVEQLSTYKDEGIIAVYGVDNDNYFIDTENALFYNMGTAAFREIAHYKIAYDTLSPEESSLLFAQAGLKKYHHYYSYQVSGFSLCKTSPVLSWEKMELFSLRGEHKPFDYWKLLREHIDEVVVHQDKAMKGQFGIELHIYEPNVKTINLANPMKALLDGIICAFHKMPMEVDEELIAIVSHRLNISDQTLLYNSKAVLGEEVFVKPYRNNVIWNPQDDRCSTVSISIEYGSSKRCISGKIYEVL
ncbi:hypothetical protein LJC42_02240 [Eubacteriales bacterium OttesenSCG-928-K08]|nr:hypothetical protein [Eubacteriales bacterium OttesenSCG-928-K08]